MKVIPLGDKVVVKRLESESRTAGNGLKDWISSQRSLVRRWQ